MNTLTIPNSYLGYIQMAHQIILVIVPSILKAQTYTTRRLKDTAERHPLTTVNEIPSKSSSDVEKEET